MARIWFKRLLIAVGTVSTATVFLLITILLFVQDNTVLFDILTFFLGSLVCSLPFLLLGILATGLELLLKSTQKKKKIAEPSYTINDDMRLQDIMSKLFPQERAFLESRLAKREFGLGDDGEMLSVDDLLSEFEEKSKRD